MRNRIIREIFSLMKERKDIYFLTADLGFDLLEDMEKAYPGRFINTGVAEQDMIGLACGLALSGKKVYVYSIIPFATMRCFEQIRNDICFHSADVTILGVGVGASYGVLGNTHFAFEDIGILRTLPNITILSPADMVEAAAAVRHFAGIKRPLYIRMGNDIEPVFDRKKYHFQSKGIIMQNGRDGVIFSTGTIVREVLQAVQKLRSEKITNPTLANIHTIKPLDGKFISGLAKTGKYVITIEEHGIGGLGSAVLETLADSGISGPYLRICAPNKLIKKIGTAGYIRKKLHLDSGGIYEKIRKWRQKNAS